MKIFSSVPEFRLAIHNRRRVVFVPTMGNLHAGHLSLVKQARDNGDTVVVSIFVNPLQFGPNEDFDKYPRTLADDCQQLELAGADVLFAPSGVDFYPEPQEYRIDLPDIQNQLEGEFRPGHFKGVATVVLKLFNIVQPKAAVFGRKDYQQLIIVRNMVRQLALPIEIIAGDTVRAEDDLALSSRNSYLTVAERNEAPRLYRLLKEMRTALLCGEHDYAKLENAAIEELNSHGWKTDYVAIRRQSDLQPPQALNEALVILAASRLGATRLIDNTEI